MARTKILLMILLFCLLALGSSIIILVYQSKTYLSDQGVTKTHLSEQKPKKLSETDIFNQIGQTGETKLCGKSKYYQDCVSFAAQIQNQADLCFSLAGQQNQDVCLAKIAERTLNPEHCQRSVDPLVKNQCLQKIVEITNNPEFCELLEKQSVPYTQDECFFDIARINNKPELCSRAGEFTDQCLLINGIKNQNLEKCQKIEEQEMRNFCFYYNSVLSSQIRPCALIKEEPLLSLCRAQATMDTNLCQEIKVDKVRQFCEKTMAVKFSRPDSCNQDFDCLVDLAIAQDDLKICELLDNAKRIKQCKIFLAVRNTKQDVCLTLGSAKAKAECLSSLAYASGNYQYCEMIESGEFEADINLMRKMCIYRVARINGDLNICYNFFPKQNDEWKACIQEVFHNDTLINTDPQLCINIQDDYFRMVCYYLLGMSVGEERYCQEIVKIPVADQYKNEKYQTCLKKVVEKVQSRYITHFNKEVLAQKPQSVDVFSIKARPGEGITHLANRALTKFLYSLTSKEQYEIDFEITLAHQIFIEDYLKDKIVAARGTRFVSKREVISISKNLIWEAIHASKDLSQEQLKTLLQYSFAKYKINLPREDDAIANYCVLQEVMRSDLSDNTAEQVLCRASFTGDYELCEIVTDQRQRNRCYQGIAELTENYTICERFKDKHNKIFCYDNFAVVKNSPEICKQNQDIYVQNACINTVAIRNTAEEEVCQQITDQFSRASCYQNLAVEQGDTSFCENILDSNTKTWCYINLAEKLSDSSLCQRIQEAKPRLTEVFRNICLSKVGQTDVGNCMMISDYEESVLCYVSYFEKHYFNIPKEGCIKFEGVDKMFCQLKQAKQLKDAQICAQIPQLEIYDYCAFVVEDGTQNSLCHNIISLTYKDACFRNRAQYLHNYTFCQFITDRYERDKCFSNVANLLEDKTPCQYLSTDSFFKASCGGQFIGKKEDYLK